MVTHNKCTNCHWWDTEYPIVRSDRDLGVCRSHPPSVVVFPRDDQYSTTNRVQIASRFPITTADDWCGDFEQKD